MFRYNNGVFGNGLHCYFILYITDCITELILALISGFHRAFLQSIAFIIHRMHSIV